MDRKRKFVQYFVVLSLSLVLTLGMAAPVMAQGESEEAYDDPFQKFQQVLYLIRNYHVEDVEMEKLVNGAIKGMLNEIDAFSYYMTPDEYEEMQIEFEGHFGGIGIRIITRNNELTIVSPIKGTPGDRVGLEAEDIITHVNGEPTSEMTQKEAVDMMRGEPGTEVQLTIKREGEEDPLKFNITRADIEIPYIESEIKEDNIGYISVIEFGDGVGMKVRKAITSLKDKGAEGIVLDLRSNPGGLLNEAVNVASNFLRKGTVVSVRQRQGDNEVLEVSNQIRAVDLPLVVMINRGSASASEIVAGAIQDRDRGKLVGTRTFGKGTVQRVIPLQDDSAVRLTIARYYTPGGNFIHEKGIEPDIEIKYDPEDEEDNQLQKAIEILQEEMEKQKMKKAG